MACDAVRLVESHSIEERLVVDGGGFVESLDEMVHVGHFIDISQSQVCQLLVRVGVPGDLIVVRGGRVEYLVGPGLPTN